jgi:hypothetical protein
MILLESINYLFNDKISSSHFFLLLCMRLKHNYNMASVAIEMWGKYNDTRMYFLILRIYNVITDTWYN